MVLRVLLFYCQDTYITWFVSLVVHMVVLAAHVYVTQTPAVRMCSISSSTLLPGCVATLGLRPWFEGPEIALYLADARMCSRAILREHQYSWYGIVLNAALLDIIHSIEFFDSPLMNMARLGALTYSCPSY